jgi:hypothetical protein
MKEMQVKLAIIVYKHRQIITLSEENHKHYHYHHYNYN